MTTLKEAQEQIIFVKKIRADYDVFICSSGNENTNNIRMNSRLKMMGKVSMPDIMIISNNNHMFIEFKQKGKTLGPNQLDVIKLLQQQNSIVKVVYSAEEALFEFLQWYK